MKKEYSSNITIMKAFAAISIVCAHVSVVPTEFKEISQYVCTVMSEIGAIGVGVFFLISGWLFSVGKSRHMKFLSFWKQKILTVGIPWIVSATLVYLYVALRKGGNIGEYIASCLGYMSSYWYLSMLFLIFFIYWFAAKVKYVHVVTAIVGLSCMVSLILRMYKIIPASAWGIYLNVLNWIIFFAIGYWLAEKKIKTPRILFKKWVIVICVCFSLMILLLVPVLGQKFSYFAYFYIPIEFVFIATLYVVTINMGGHIGSILEKIGEYSFPIYLYNEFVWAGAVVAIGNKWDNWIILLLRPIVVLVGVIFEIVIGKWLFARFNKNELFCKVIGIKK